MKKNQEPTPVKIGRPPYVNGKRVQVYLDDKSLSKAAHIGKGNVSAGIRQALLGTNKEVK